MPHKFLNINPARVVHVHALKDRLKRVPIVVANVGRQLEQLCKLGVGPQPQDELRTRESSVVVPVRARKYLA